MTPAELDAICQRLYGPRWQSAFARDIARERETVNRWARGRSPIPKAVERWLARALERPDLRSKGSGG
jgi:hypothetical protein